MQKATIHLQEYNLSGERSAATDNRPVSTDEMSRLPELLHRSASREWYDYDDSPTSTGGGFLSNLY